MKPIAIFGAGGLGKEVLALIRALPEWEPVGFYDDQIQKGVMLNGIEILGNTDRLKKDAVKDLNLIIAVGNPQVKKAIVDMLKGIRKIRYPSLVHPSAIIVDLASVRIGAGAIVTAGCILTTNISIGTHVLLNINSTIGHDCRIGDYSSIMPGANLSGDVKVGTEVLIGSGANVMNGVSLGDRCKIGMGAAVLRNVENGSTAVGVPAKTIGDK